MGIVIGIVIGLLIISPRFFVDFSFMKSTCEEITDKPFVCPNCGHEFYVSWYRMWFKKNSVYLWNSARLRCPNCGSKDMCKHKE